MNAIVRLLAVSGSFLAASAALPLIGCAAARMQVDPGLAAGAEKLPVNVDKSLTSYNAIGIGPYQAEDLDVAWKSTSGAKVGPVSGSDTSKKYAFKVTASGKTVGAKCEYTKSAKGVVMGIATAGASEGVTCTFAGAGDGAALAVKRGEAGFAGQATVNGRAYGIASRHVVAGGGSSSSPVGYDVRVGEKLLAEMQTSTEPTVWLDKSADADDKLAAATLMIGLYLFNDAT